MALIHKSIYSFFCLALCFAISAPLKAQELLFHLPLDGSLQNNGSIGGAPALYTKDSASVPTYVAGYSGQAMQFAYNQKAAIALPYELHPQSTPQVTFTAWVKQDPGASGSRTVVSSGLARVGVNGGKVAAKAGAQGVQFGSTMNDSEWVFIAAVFDVNARTVRLHQGSDVMTETNVDMSTSAPPTFNNPNDPDADKQAYLFVGANQFKTYGMSQRGVVIDDMRVYAGAMSEPEINALRNSDPVEAPSTPDVASGDPSPDSTPPSAPESSPPSTDTAESTDTSDQPADTTSNDSNTATDETVASIPDNITGPQPADTAIGTPPTVRTPPAPESSGRDLSLPESISDPQPNTTGIDPSQPGTSEGETVSGVLDGLGDVPDDQKSFGEILEDAVPEELTPEEGIGTPPFQNDTLSEDEMETVQDARDTQARPDLENAEAKPDESSSDEETTHQQALTPEEGSGKVVATGERLYTGIAGYEGANQAILELGEGYFLTSILWDEQGDRPCYLSISDNSRGRDEPSGFNEFNKCGYGFSPFGSMALNYAEVSLGSASNERLACDNDSDM